MRIISSPNQIQKTCLALKRRGKTIAIVPTMGFLHEGHLALVRKAREVSDIVVMTIFVNPTQFGPKEAFSKYPRDTKGDLAKARRAGVDFVFLPNVRSIYPADYETYVEVTRATRGLCGKSRPVHFRGVTTIVCKLFNIVQPDFAIFGLKDFQQCAVIKRMVKDLNLPIQVIGVPTVREKDGLAMSSRNVYLNPSERKAALVLSLSLRQIASEVQKGTRNLAALKRQLVTLIRRELLTRIDYVEVMDSETMQPLKKYRPRKTLFAVAVFIGKTRLIDNRVV